MMQSSYAVPLLNTIGDVAAKWEVKYMTVILTGHSKLRGHVRNLKFQIILPGVLEVVIQWRYICCAAMSSYWGLLSISVKSQSQNYSPSFRVTAGIRFEDVHMSR